MAGKSDKDKQKALQEKHQTILNDLLKEKCNRYCIDCNCKGPRWASWNLGVFLCIRCAGIHRNLGVHISRVKSVNLDSWTPEQIAVMQQMGNSNAKSIYEANLPANFPVPQTDSALEALIRAKYEHKKYIDKDWSPPLPKVQSVAIIVKKEKKHRNRSLPSRKPPTTAKSESPDTSPAVERKNKKPAVMNTEGVELLTLDVPENQVKTDSAFQDILCLNDGLTANGLTANGLTTIPLVPGDGLATDVATLDLLDPNSLEPGPPRLANNAILALYRPSNNAVFSGVPGGLYCPPQQAPALYGVFQSSGVVGRSSGVGNGPAGNQMPGMMGSTKADVSPLTSSPSSVPGATWAQPSMVGRTLCTSLWQ